MRFARLFGVLIVVAVIASAGEAGERPVLHPGDVPIGGLGHPLGTYLTIEGVREEEGKVGVCTLRVDTINGKKLDKPTSIWIDNLDLPPKMRLAIKGYETMRMVGAPPAAEAAAAEAGKPFVPPQLGWQVQCYFIAIKVLKQVRADPVASLRPVLPEGWRVLRVEEKTYPGDRPKGEGKAIFLVGPRRTTMKQDYHAIIYIMPADYEDGSADPTRGRAQEPPARFFLATPDARIYLFPPGVLSVPGWPTFSEDVFRAILD